MAELRSLAVTSPGPVAPRGWAQGRTGLVTFLAAGIAAALANAGFQRLAGSRIDVDDLGAVNALLAVVGGIGLLGLGLQVAVARTGVVRVAMGRLAAGAGLIAAAGALAAVPGPWWYRCAVAAALAVTIGAVLLGVPHRARLLADASWRRVGAVYVSGAAARLVALAPALALVDQRLVAVMVATAVGESVTTAVAWWLARPQYLGVWNAPPRRIDAATGRALVRASIALLGLWALTVADTVVARLRLPATQADSYAFGSTVARSSFFLAVLLAHFALPTFMSDRGRSERLRRAFSTTVLTTAAGALAVASVILVAPRWSAELLLGEDAAIAGDGTLRWLAVAWALLSVVPLLTYLHLDRHPRLALAPLVAAVAVVGAGFVADDDHTLAVVVALVAFATVGVMGVPASHRLAPVTRSTSWAPSGVRTAGDVRDVAVVVPFFNPGGAVVIDTVGRLGAALAGAGIAHRIVAVSDGSTDGSAAALRAAGLDHVDVVELDVNRGKGAALREGFGHCRSTLVGYLDADGDLPPEQFVALVSIASATGADAVVGSKVHPDSALEVEGHRLVMSSVFRMLVRLLFRLDVRDTQTGIKLYRGDVVGEIGPALREDGFAIDVELLVAAMRHGHRRIVEAPVTIARGASTTVSARRAVATVVALFRIAWRDHVALAYERIEPSARPSVGVA